MERRTARKYLNVRYWSCYVLFNILFVCGFGLVICKAFQMQVLEHSEWVERGRMQAETVIDVPAYRGSIVDRKGQLLSFSVPQRSLSFSLSPTPPNVSAEQLATPRRQLAAQIAAVLGEPSRCIEEKLERGRRFVWLKRHLTDVQALAVERVKERFAGKQATPAEKHLGGGVHLVSEYKRFYPYRHLAGQVLGFVGMDGLGLEGIEKSYDQVLREKACQVGQYRDGVRKCLWMDSDPPPESQENYGVRLTLDIVLQHICEDELEKAVQQYKAKGGEVVVMDPNTFEILAMANYPSFDPNLAHAKKNADVVRNRTITDSFEPGSTFKVFLMSAALEEAVVRERDRVYCENGQCRLAGHNINDVHPYGWLTIPEVIKYSSNIAAGKLALQLGNERYHKYIRSFGFGEPTGITLPGEVRGLVRPHRKWRPIDLVTTGFGQSIGVTSLQLTAGIASIANGGEYGKPSVVKEILDAQGNVMQEHTAPTRRRVLQKRTAEKIRDMMHLVCQEGGTGVKAVPAGYTAAGKTGTAQVMDSVTKRYASNRYTSLFTGFIPADKPRLVITVVIHEPHGASYGGVVAAPVFRNFAARALPYLGVYPAAPESCPAPGLRKAEAPASKSKGAVVEAKPVSARLPNKGERNVKGEKEKEPKRIASPPVKTASAGGAPSSSAREVRPGTEGGKAPPVEKAAAAANSPPPKVCSVKVDTKTGVGLD